MNNSRLLLPALTIAACSGQFQFPGLGTTSSSSSSSGGLMSSRTGSPSSSSPSASPSPSPSSAPSSSSSSSSSSKRAAPTRTADSGDPDTTPPRGYPAWCAGHRGSTETGQLELKRDLEGRDGEREGWYNNNTVRHLAQASCAWRNNDAAETQKIQAIYHQRRAELMKLAQLTDAETDELLAATLDEMKSKQAESDACGKLGAEDEDDKAKVTSKDAAERTSRGFMACHGDAGVYDWPDASELQKFASAGNCLSHIANGVGHNMGRGPRLNIEFGTCNAMLAHVDLAKLDAELKVFAPIQRAWAKIRRGTILGSAANAREYFTTYAQKNPEWKPVLFDEPAKAYLGFMAAYTANKALFDKAKFLIENHGQHKLVGKLGGCQEAFWTPLAKLVASKHPTTKEAGSDAMHDQTAYMLARGLVACAELDKRADVVSTFDKPLANAPTGSGPEQAIQWALVRYINAHGEALDEKLDSDATQMITMFRKDALETRGDVSLNEITGVIASVSPAASGWVKVTFKTETWMQDEFDCVETNKIDGIKSDGTLVYRQNCTYKGQSKHASTEPPVTVEARFAGALKPGRLAELGETREAGGGNERRAVPKIVHASKDPKAPMVGYLGFSW